VTYKKSLVDIISMVKHAAKEQEPLLTAEERVDRAIARLASGVVLPEEQQKWLNRIREHLVQNLSIDQGDFDIVPVLANAGGWRPADHAFDGKLAELLKKLNEGVAA
jgi:type I restriction enzyme R subunit